MSTSSPCDQVASDTSHFYPSHHLPESGTKQQLITATFQPIMQHFPQTLPFHTPIVPSHDPQRLDTWRELSCQEQQVTGTFVPFVTAAEYEQIARGYQTSIAPWENSYSVQEQGASSQLYASQEIPEHMGYEYCNQKYVSYNNYHEATTKVSLQEFDVFHPSDILALEAPIEQKQERTESDLREQEAATEFIASSNPAPPNEEYIVTSLDDSSASVLPSFCCFEQHQEQRVDEQDRNGDPGLVTRFNYCSFFTPNEGMNKNPYTAI